ncbi:MAG: carboxylesterase family protein, partial [Acidobacteria bacterium]|nr:carboxylesterase family protein [Acidobacteriota bacterium]
QCTTPVFGAYMAGGKQWPELLQEEESENCLYVNVVTPSVKGKRPVIAYIHGGAFSNGSGLLTVFADAHAREHDLVLVGITHRLNVFGYSYLGGLSDKYKVGNAGQLDLVLALRWIRDNIANFGGDPNSITLWGDSGGGAKICTLMAMPEAQGLFHKAIVSSGSLLRADSPRKGTAGARDMLAKLGLKENQIAELHKLPAQKLYKASKGGWPVVDGHSVPRQTWDPQAPEGSANVAMIVGHCSHETSVFAATGQPQMLELDEAGLRASLVKANIPGAEVGNVIALYRRDHPKEPPSALYFRIMADRGARTNVIAQAERKIEQGKASVYVYQFNWATPVFGGKLFAWHTAEMPLAARIVLYPESDQLSKQISGAYAAFARTGSPNGGGLPEWPAYTTTRRATMIWDIPKSEAVNDPDPQERRLIAKYPSGSLL